MRKNYKKLAAIALTVAMTMGSTITAFAATSGDVSGGIDSEGKYEGGEIPYPAISVTLPTVPADSIDYIADPNDLIKSTLNASGDAINGDYANSVFNSDTGIYFRTTDASGTAVKAQYTEKSRPMVITNENAQNLNVTVKVEQTKAASGDAIAYVNTPTFASGDTVKKLYLAVTDGTTTKALETSGGVTSASFTTEVKGKADNFEPKYNNSTKKYSFDKKANASGWSTASYQLTGAINKNAKWQDEIEFPNVRITWSWVEGAVEKAPANKAPSIATKAYTVTAGQSVEVNLDMGSGDKKATGIESILNGYSNTMVNETLYTYSNGKLTLAGGLSTWFKGKNVTSADLTIKFNDTAKTTETIKLTIN